MFFSLYFPILRNNAVYSSLSIVALTMSGFVPLKIDSPNKMPKVAGWKMGKSVCGLSIGKIWVSISHLPAL